MVGRFNAHSLSFIGKIETYVLIHTPAGFLQVLTVPCYMKKLMTDRQAEPD